MLENNRPRNVCIDCKDHLLGRLTAAVAKQLLEGVRVTLVRCEEVIIGGSLKTNKLKFQSFLRKHSNTNPRKHSHIHYRCPSMIVWRTVRGMLPHRKARGAVALSNLKVYEGVPNQVQKTRKQVIPEALKVLRLKPVTPHCRLGDLASRVGWKHDELVQRMEEKRRAEGASWFEGRKEEIAKWKDAKRQALEKLKPDQKEIIMQAGMA